MQERARRGLMAVAATALMGAATLAPSRAADLITNGGFEQPQLQQSWQLFNSIPGWTASADLIELGYGWVYGIGGDNTQVLELDANANATVDQPLNLAAGQYLLSLDYARRVNMPGLPADTCDFNVVWDGNVIASVTDPLNTTMQPLSLSITTGAGPHTLALQGAGSSDSYGVLIDNVSLASAVPEPGAWTMLVGAAVFGAGLLRRRIRR